MREARQIFFAYDCNSFHRDRDGAGARYNTFRVPEDTERAWRQEFLADWLARLQGGELTALAHLEVAEALETVPAVLEWASQTDSYGRLLAALMLAQLAVVPRSAGDTATAEWLWQQRTTLVQRIIDEPPSLNAASVPHAARMLGGLSGGTLAERVQQYAAMMRGQVQT